VDLTTGPIDKNKRYIRVGPLAFDEELLIIMNQGVVIGSVLRRSINAIRIEPRTSFKHPIVGTVVGLVGVAGLLVPNAVRTFGLQDDDWIQPLRILGFVMAVIGLILLLGVVRRRQIPWLVVDTDSGQRCFPLENEVTPQVEQLINDAQNLKLADGYVGFRQV
jgi:hypothetical protein